MNRVGNDLLAELWVFKVSGDRQATGAFGTHLLGSFHRIVVLVQIGEHDVCTFACEQHGDGAADAEVDAARVQLDRIKFESSPYRGWVICLGQMMLGAGVAAILGGGATEMFLAAVAGGLLYLVQQSLLRTQLSVLFIQALGAAVPTAMGMAAM